MSATLVVTFMIPNWAILTTASLPAPLSKTSPRIGFAPSAAWARKTSVQKTKGQVNKLTG